MAGKALVAAGLIIFRRIENEIQYLLLQTSYGENHWTPPKGHVDPGESEFETALRETKEEAGLDQKHFDIVKDFTRTLHYEVRNRPKRVVYWLAELKNCDCSVTLSDEHIDYKWLNLNQANSYINKYKDMQEALEAAETYIKSSL